MPDQGVVEAKPPVSATPEARSAVSGIRRLALPDEQNITTQAEAGIKGEISGVEALAGIAGWRFRGVITHNIETIEHRVSKLYNRGKINKEQVDEMAKKINKFREKTEEVLDPQIGNLVKQAEAAEKSGKPDLFFWDLDIHFMKSELQLAEKAGDEIQVRQLKRDLAAAEARRANFKDNNGQVPEDQVVKFAQDLTGGKELSDIESFFQKEFSKIIGSEETRMKLAAKLGVSPNQLLEIGHAYESGDALAKEFDNLQNEIDDIEHPGRKRLDQLKRTSLKFGGILGALIVFMAYRAMQTKQQQAQY